MILFRACYLGILFLVMTLKCYGAPEPHPKVIDGYPIANFALTVNASEDGGFFRRIFQNPGKLGEWLKDRGAVTFSCKKGNEKHSFSSFREKKIQRSFPFVKNVYDRSALISTRIQIETFCPLGINDIETSSLPVLFLELDCLNADSEEEFEIIIQPDTPMNVHSCKTLGYSGIKNEEFQLTSDAKTIWKNGELAIHISMKPNQLKRVRVLLTFYDKDWIAANRFSSIDEITAYAYRTWSDLKLRTEIFSKAIPETGDKELDTYLRWYMIPGISLTKCTKKNEVLTMGYCELNQRDSYWTSWLHLVLFKDLERRMIEESIAWQQSSGKIPTTILPLIEREDDLDINAFFILRATRYYQLYHNKDELRTWWPAMKKAMDWLVSRDINGNGLPVQVSFWGDWKDVVGVNGRIYSPFSGLIYLAALMKMEELAKICGDERSVSTYGAAYKKGFEFINKPTKDGGLWNGYYYCQRWKDNKVNEKLLQDQMIGVLFGVVPPERAELIINSLNDNNLTKYGICETYPYYPTEFGYEPGTYHNGGVWPWLSFMDDWARIRIGREKEAIDLVKRVASADLVVSGDWSPNEYMNSCTGLNQGFQLQGWNAGLFGLVYFGLLHKDIIP